MSIGSYITVISNKRLSDMHRPVESHNYVNAAGSGLIPTTDKNDFGDEQIDETCESGE